MLNALTCGAPPASAPTTRGSIGAETGAPAGPSLDSGSGGGGGGVGGALHPVAGAIGFCSTRDPGRVLVKARRAVRALGGLRRGHGLVELEGRREGALAVVGSPAHRDVS